MAAVVGPDSRIHLKKLSIGRDFGNALEVLDGVSPADQIVVNPPDALAEGELVNIAGQDAQGSANTSGAQTSKP